MSCDSVKPDDIGNRVGRSGKTVRAWLRRRWPDQAPGQGDEWALDHRQVQEVLAHFGGAGADAPSIEPRSLTRNVPQPPRRKRQDSDQTYVIHLVAEVLGESPLEEPRFSWLRGDAGTTLPVDAYFPEHDLVVEYRERQHLTERPDSFKFWDSKPTASGIPRSEQRARYDELREREIPDHGLRLLIINADDLLTTRGEGWCGTERPTS